MLYVCIKVHRLQLQRLSTAVTGHQGGIAIRCFSASSRSLTLLTCEFAAIARTLGPVALKLGDKVLVKVRGNTTITDLLEQGLQGWQDSRSNGYEVTAHQSENLPEGEYAVLQPIVGEPIVLLLCTTQ